MQPLSISASAVVSAMGRGAAMTLMALRTRAGGLRPCDFADVTAGHIGRVEGLEAHRLAPALGRFDCRNNRLADLALHTDGFADAVAAARDAYGPSRIAVVLGTSTGGILASEDAYRRRDPETGALPDGFDYEHTQDLFSLGGFVRAALGLNGP
ncbi:MAG: beta-ketoacyl-[acyl-carrier-protein] synthase II, partial [Acetobacteraceae bacterium]